MPPLFDAHEVSREIIAGPKNLSLVPAPTPSPEQPEPDLELPEVIDIQKVAQSIRNRVEDVVRLIGQKSYDGFSRAMELYEKSIEDGKIDKDIADIQELVDIQIRTIVILIRTAEHRQKFQRRAESTRRKNEQLKEINAVLDKENKTDVVTNLYNRRGLKKEGKKVFEHCREKGIPLSCLYLDIDYFKPINDIYGHDIGDVVLRKIGDIITSEIRGADLAFSSPEPGKPIAGRDGGEEFVILMPFTDLAEAMVAAERIRKRIQHEPIDVVKSNGITQTISLNITCTIGVSQTDFQRDKKVDQTKRLADTAMSLGKQQHRNIVSVAKNNPEGHGLSVDYPYVDDPDRKIITDVPRYPKLLSSHDADDDGAENPPVDIDEDER